MGSRATTPQKLNWAYIAGFFDGDGSLMAQVKNRRDTPTGWRIMFTICLYQDSRHKEPLQWMQKVLGSGYLHDRRDGITEYRINGYSAVRKILINIQPYVRFKKKQVNYALKILEVIEGKKFPLLPRKMRKLTAGWMLQLRAANYKAHQPQRSASEIEKLLAF